MVSLVPVDKQLELSSDHGVTVGKRSKSQSSATTTLLSLSLPSNNRKRTGVMLATKSKQRTATTLTNYLQRNKVFYSVVRFFGLILLLYIAFNQFILHNTSIQKTWDNNFMKGDLNLLFYNNQNATAHTIQTDGIRRNDNILGFNNTTSNISVTKRTATGNDSSSISSRGDIAQSDKRCAILFWGLPRAFESLVLPSIEENVIRPNQQYNCDYFVHFYHQTTENSGRSGSGGDINPDAIYSLKTVIEKHHSIGSTKSDMIRPSSPLVEFTFETEEDFWKKYTPLIQKIRSTKDMNGKYYYYPWKAQTYIYPTTTDNIIKMWHSIESCWNFMLSKSISTKTLYEQVAMLRSDVFYVNPIDIFQNPTTNKSMADVSFDTKFVVIPNFGNHPISDRIIYGPFDAVKVWATERFSSLERHVKFIYEHDKGWGLHSERFMNYTIFPAIRQLGFKILHHQTMCFLRARVDETIWISDCYGSGGVADPKIMESLGGSFSSVKTIVEHIIHRKCSRIAKGKRRNVQILPCPQQ
jgi:hypothetical protein